MTNDEPRPEQQSAEQKPAPIGAAGGKFPHEDALGMAALRALAHPLRVEIMNELSDFGPATASMLAERLGESSGATSYHLRQLAKHDIIVEDTERGSGRERWWRMAPGGVTIGSPETLDTPAGREANELISLGFPVLFGASRKSYLGSLLADESGQPRPVHQREAATIATSVLAVAAGVWGVRVHEVLSTVDALKVWEATCQARSI